MAGYHALMFGRPIWMLGLLKCQERPARERLRPRDQCEAHIMPTRRQPFDAARRFCSALSDLTDCRPQRWPRLRSVAERLRMTWGSVAAAAIEAEAKGWITMEGRHSVCLTEAGRGLVPVPLPPSIRRA